MATIWKLNIGKKYFGYGIVKIQDNKIPKQACCTVLFMREKKSNEAFAVYQREQYISTSANRRCGMSFLKSGLEKMRKQTGEPARTPTMSLASKWLP